MVLAAAAVTAALTAKLAPPVGMAATSPRPIATAAMSIWVSRSCAATAATFSSMMRACQFSALTSRLVMSRRCGSFQTENLPPISLWTVVMFFSQRHTDLKNGFYQHVKERGGPSALETRLRGIIFKLRKTIDNKNRELSQLRADVPALVRVVNELTLENQQLRDQLTHPTGAVIRMHCR
jgi:hypothetical protein